MNRPSPFDIMRLAPLRALIGDVIHLTTVPNDPLAGRQIQTGILENVTDSYITIRTNTSDGKVHCHAIAPSQIVSILRIEKGVYIDVRV